MALVYRGKITVDNAAYHAPYIPDVIIGWRGYLNELALIAGSMTKNPEVLYEDIEFLMKERYPGNYRITSILDRDTLRYRFNLVFDTDEDRTVFLLKWT